MNDPGTGNGRSETWRTWVPPILAAVITATLGVTASAVIDGCNRNREAENTARVLDQNLWAAEDAMVRSMEDRRYRLYDLKLNFPLDDQKRLADELGADYEDVAEAAAAYSLQLSRAREEHVFAQYDDVQLACARETVAQGRRALREITEVPKKTLPDPERLERGCQIEQVELAAEQYYDDFVHPHRDHPANLHPHSNAYMVDLAEDLRSATVELENARGKQVGKLLLTDEKRSGEWQVDDVLQRLEPVQLPSDSPKRKASK